MLRPPALRACGFWIPVARLRRIDVHGVARSSAMAPSVRLSVGKWRSRKHGTKCSNALYRPLRSGGYAMRLAGLALLGLVGALLWKPQTDINVINAIIGGLGLTFLAIGSIGHERRRR